MDKRDYCRVAEDKSQLYKFVEDACEQSSSDVAVKKLRADEGDILTEEIAASLTPGDILLVDRMAFPIVRLVDSPLTFSGSYAFAFSGKITVNMVEWVLGEALTITATTLS